jgi:GNAT superfamily N-acetyltransferase
MASEQRIVPLERAHNRASFDCGEASLNVFLQCHALQNRNAGYSVTYILQEGASPDILGYHTISSGVFSCTLLPPHEAKKLPRYMMPVLRLARLAVDRRQQGRGLGGLLLVDVLRRAVALTNEPGIAAVEVDALTDTARVFYERFGFRALADDRRHFYLPVRTVRDALVTIDPA